MTSRNSRDMRRDEGTGRGVPGTVKHFIHERRRRVAIRQQSAVRRTLGLEDSRYFASSSAICARCCTKNASGTTTTAEARYSVVMAKAARDPEYSVAFHW